MHHPFFEKQTSFTLNLKNVELQSTASKSPGTCTFEASNGDSVFIPEMYYKEEVASVQSNAESIWLRNLIDLFAAIIFNQFKINYELIIMQIIALIFIVYLLI